MRSALAHMHKTSGEEFSKSSQKDISQFISGMKRTVMKPRINLSRALDEGNK